MNAKEFLRVRLTELVSVFTNIKIRYEFRQCTQSHLIEVTPLDFYDNDEKYLIEEAAIEKEFENSFPQESIVFISEDSLTEIKDAEFELGYCESIVFNNSSLNIEFEVNGFSNIIEQPTPIIKQEARFALAA